MEDNDEETKRQVEHAVSEILKIVQAGIANQKSMESVWVTFPPDVASCDVPSAEFPYEVHILAIKDMYDRGWAPAIEMITGIFHCGNFYSHETTVKIGSSYNSSSGLCETEKEALRRAHQMRVRAVRELQDFEEWRRRAFAFYNSGGDITGSL